MRLELRPSVLLTPNENGYFAFDIASRQLHSLNPTAALVIELCDGSRTIDDLRAALQPIIGETGWPAWRSWIESAVEGGLLRSAASSESSSTLSAKTLSRLAQGLQEEGRVLEAFICRQRAAELDAENPDQWYSLGELAHIVERRADARLAYERYLALRPDDTEIAHILNALRDAPPPPRASSEYVKDLFSRFASFYDESMNDDLEYRAPQLLAEALTRAFDGRQLDILDLGCGTGLGGQAVRAQARLLVGVDLSADMLVHAEKRGIYDRLHLDEITAWLRQHAHEADAERFTAIMACDALIYFGDLRQVLNPAAKCLAPGGVVAFTVEQGANAPFKLSDAGRFTHHRKHVEDATCDAGLSIVSMDEAVLRYEYGSAVAGLVVVARR